MAKYYVDGNQYETSLTGLYIDSDSDNNVLFLCSKEEGTMREMFSQDPEWSNPENRMTVIINATDDRRSVETIEYCAWKSIEEANPWREVELDEVDKAYLAGLLTQYWWWDDEDEY